MEVKTSDYEIVFDKKHFTFRQRARWAVKILLGFRTKVFVKKEEKE